VKQHFPGVAKPKLEVGTKEVPADQLTPEDHAELASDLH
jgi:hypothetical protein